MKSDLWTEVLEKGVDAVAKALTTQETIDLTNRYGTHNYKPLPVNVVRAEGAKVWDSEGREFIDCIGAYSAVTHGHLGAEVVKAAKAQLDQVAVTSRAYYNAHVALFLRALCEYAGMDMACPMNSGAEAIETCLKLARKWAYTVKGIPAGQAEVIVFEENFHGRTITIVGFSSEEGYKRHFGPFTPGFKVVPYGDIDALRAAITSNTAAILGESIQAEGGILIPYEGFLRDVRELATEANCLLIWDEVQTGFCRTGYRFGWQHEDAAPDLMAVGKALGGGLLPVSAAVGKAEVMETFKPGDHGSTFGGNPLGSAVAIAAMADLEVNDFAGRSKRLGHMAMERLASMNMKGIKELRGRGLLIGIEVTDEVDTKKLAEALMRHGLLTKETRHRTFRLTPPISIEDEVLVDALNRFGAAMKEVTG